MKDKSNRNGEKSLNLFSKKESINIYLTKKAKLCPPENDAIRNYFSIDSKKFVLDLGCGTGRTTKPLMDIGLQPIGIDISDKMIHEAKLRFPDIDFLIGDASELNFKNETFDYVLFSFNGLDYIYPESKRIMALKEIHRVLKPEGIFIFSSHNSIPLFSKNPFFYYWLIKFIVKNTIRKTMFAKYKIDPGTIGDLNTYFINPFRQKKQLLECGFKLIEIKGFFKSKAKLFETWPYYIAKKILGN